MVDYALPRGRHDLTVSCAPGVKVEWKLSGRPTGYVKIWHVDMTEAEAGSRHRIRDCVVEELGGGTTAVAGVVYTNTEQNPTNPTIFRIEDSRITLRSVGEAKGESTYEAACGTGRDHGVSQGVTRVEIVDSECTARGSGGIILLNRLRVIADGTAPTPHVFFNWDFGQLLGDVFVDTTHSQQILGDCFGVGANGFSCGIPLFNVGGIGDSYWVETSTALFPIALTIRGPEPHRPANLLGPKALAAPLAIGPGYIDGGSRDYVNFNADGDRSSGICARELWAEGNPTESAETHDYLDFENHDMGPLREKEETYRVFSTIEVHGLNCVVDTAPGPGNQWQMRVLVDGVKLPGTMLTFDGFSESTTGVNDVRCTISGLETSCTSGFEGGVTDQGTARFTVSVDSSGGNGGPKKAGLLRCSVCLGRAKPRI